jgi:hypothetical protein
MLAWPGGCAGGSDGPSSRVERSDSAGLAIVSTRGSDIAAPWHLEKILDLGGKDAGPEAFVRIHPTSVGSDSAGNLYVLDAGTHTITIFDRAGTAKLSFGRQGGGPGEFGFPSDLAVTPDGRTGVYDFAVRGLVRFAPDGSVLPTRVMPGTTRKFVLYDDRVVGAFRVHGERSDSSRQSMLDFGTSDTITLLSRYEPEAKSVNVGCMQIGLPPIYSQDLAWGASAQRIVMGDPVAYIIHVFEAGRLIAQWRRDIQPMQTTPAFAAIEVGGDSMRFQAGPTRCAVSAREAVESIGYLPFVPLIRDLIVAPDGRVLAQRRTATPGETRIDVFGEDGSYLGTLPAGTAFPATFRSSDEIVTVEQDSLDLRHINVYRLVPHAS